MLTSEQIDRVKNRLFLYDMISQSQGSFVGDSFLEYPSEDSWDHKYKHYEALRHYLLLTCFDILGQKDDFVDFGTFLSSKQFRVHREKALKEAESIDTIEGKIKAYYSYYNGEFGFRNRFDNFIDNVLKAEERKRLFDSIDILKISNDGSQERKDGEKDKRKFLYKLRNEFTHEGISWASPAYGVFGMVDWTWWEGKIMIGLQTQICEVKTTHRIEYRTRKWPIELRKLMQVVIERLRLTKS